jgi:hypothetical protein
MDPN